MKKFLLMAALFVTACAEKKESEPVPTESQLTAEHIDSIDDFSGASLLFMPENHEILTDQLKFISEFEKNNFQCHDLQALNSVSVSDTTERWQVTACGHNHYYNVILLRDEFGHLKPQISF